MRRVIDRFSPQRTYYYNAVDDRQKPGEADDAFKARVDAQLDRLDRINSLPNCHVRVGSITGRAVKRRRQKQVDVQLAVDALLHSFNRTASVITLVAGDLDFKPLVDALVTLGVQTRLAFEKTSTSIKLRGSADQALEINLQLAWEWSSQVFQDAHALPQRANFQAHVYGVNGYHSDSIHERIGTWRGQEVRLLRIPLGTRRERIR